MPQAMHLRLSMSTISGRSSARWIAPVGQAARHGAGSQWRHLFGKAVFRKGPGSAWMRAFGAGCSKTDQKRLYEREWATAQATSHCLQPMHRSGWTKTVLIESHPFLLQAASGLPTIRDGWREHANRICGFSSPPSCRMARPGIGLSDLAAKEDHGVHAEVRVMVRRGLLGVVVGMGPHRNTSIELPSAGAQVKIILLP